MKLLLGFTTLLLTFTSFGQKRQIFSHDFDYKGLTPIDTFANSPQKPNYYALTTYINNEITDLDLFQKEDWMKEPLQIHAKVRRMGDITFFIYNAGKTKSRGYGKLFSKKIRFSDTAMLINDTLIFKRTTPYSIQLHYATSIFSDSIQIAKKTFPIGKTSKRKVLSLFDFKNYFVWNVISGYSRYYQVLVTPKKNNVVQAKKLIQDGTIDYSYSYLHEQEYFKKHKMPISLLWIKHSGIIY